MHSGKLYIRHLFRNSGFISALTLYLVNCPTGARLNETPSPARTPLEVAVENNRLDIIMHPVIRRLISVKWRVFGKLGGIGALLLNLLYATLWTIMAVTIPTTDEDAYFPLPKKIWRWIIAIIIALLTIYEIVQQITGRIISKLLQNHPQREVKWLERYHDL